MTGRRLFYGAALTAALLLQVFYDGYLAHVVFLAALGLPLLSLALSLPGLLTLRTRLAPSAPEVERGAEGAWQLRLDCPWPLPPARLTARLRLTNRLTGAVRTVKLVCPGGRSPDPLPLDTRHCGALECRVDRLRGLDCLGLFSLSLPGPAPAAVLVLPAAGSPELPPGWEALGGQGQLRPKPGGGPGEDYELRPYRPGDPLRAIHWKLSSKLDEPVTRETLEARRPTVCLSFDHFGTPEELDRTLDRLRALAEGLLSLGAVPLICWAADGQVRRFAVTDRSGLDRCLAAALSEPAPRTGNPPELPRPPAAGGLSSLHIAAGGEVSL